MTQSRRADAADSVAAMTDAADSVAAIRLGHALLWVFGAAIRRADRGRQRRGLSSCAFESRGASAAQLEHAPLVVIPALVASGAALLGVTLFARCSPACPHGSRSACAAHDQRVRARCARHGRARPTGDWLMRLAADFYPSATLGVVPMLNELVSATPLYVVWPAFALIPGSPKSGISRPAAELARQHQPQDRAFSVLVRALSRRPPSRRGRLAARHLLGLVGARTACRDHRCARVEQQHRDSRWSGPVTRATKWLRYLGSSRAGE